MKRSCVAVFLVATISCGSKGTATAPSPTATAPASTTFSLSLRVLAHMTAMPIPGATVSIIDGPDDGKSATTDTSGNYTFTGLQQQPRFGVKVSAINYFSTSLAVTPTSSQTLMTFTIFLIETGPTIVLTGQVTDVASSAPIPGATVDINGRYRTSTDNSGSYTLTGYLDQVGSDVAYAFADGYELYARYIRGVPSQSFRLYRTERITGGGSWSVTIRPDDSLCTNNFQDPQEGLPGSGYVCRTVRVVAPSDGVMTLEAISSEGGARPPLEVEIAANGSGCPCLANPISISVTAGTEVKANIEVVAGLTTSQRFALVTSMARP